MNEQQALDASPRSHFSRGNLIPLRPPNRDDAQYFVDHHQPSKASRLANGGMSSSYLPVSPNTSSTAAFPAFPTSPTFNPYASSAGPSNGPITRSRTLFYLSIRDSSVTPRRGPKRSEREYGSRVDEGDEEEGLIGHRDTKGLPPKW